MGNHPFHPRNQAQITITAIGLLSLLPGMVPCHGELGLCPDPTPKLPAISDDPRPGIQDLWAPRALAPVLGSASTGALGFVGDDPVYRYWEQPYQAPQTPRMSAALLALLSAGDELPTGLFRSTDSQNTRSR